MTAYWLPGTNSTIHQCRLQTYVINKKCTWFTVTQGEDTREEITNDEKKLRPKELNYFGILFGIAPTEDRDDGLLPSTVHTIVFLFAQEQIKFSPRIKTFPK